MDEDKNLVRRREAIARLAKLSVYTAPAVTVLLSAQASAVIGSCGTGNNLTMDMQMGGITGDGNGDRFTFDTGMSTNSATDCA